MSDSFVQLPADSTGKKIDTRTESTNGDHRQVIILGDPDTNAGVAPVSATNGLSVNQQAIAGTTVDTNSGTKSSGTQRIVLATDQPQLTNALKVDPSAVTSPVSVSSLPLPTGASTAAKQPALGTAGTASTDVITVQGIASATPQPVSGTLTAATPLGSPTTTTPTFANASSVTLLSSNSSRKYLLVQNNSLANIMISLSNATLTGIAPTSTNIGLVLIPGQAYESGPSYTSTAAITGYQTSGGSINTVVVVEG